MYGQLGIDLTGPHNGVGGYVDLPEDAAVVALFQQGWAHLVGFNYREALRNFETVRNLSPNCALCHWGVAVSYSPNINYYVESQLELNQAAQRASALVAAQPHLQPKTKALVAAAMALVQDPSVKDGPSSPGRRGYADRLCGASNATSEDEDLAALCAGALMALSPWHYYNGTRSYGHDALLPFLRLARSKLLGALRRDPQHALAIHLLIHLEEPENAPEGYRWEALPAATRLFLTNHSELVPSQGHLTHMPAHLFLRTGEYRRGVETAQRSVENNAAYTAKCLTGYAYGHNLKMLIAHARFAAMSHVALTAADAASKSFAGEEETPGLGRACVDCAGPGSPEKVLSLLRFGMFPQVLEEPKPTSWGEKKDAAYNRGAWHYARAMALYAIGNATGADAEAHQAAAAVHGDKTYGSIIPLELEAAQAWHASPRNATAAVKALQAAVAANDDLPYLEPPRWYYPIRQCLGTVLLAANESEAAIANFKADLGVFPANGWSLLGTAQAYSALGNATLAAAYHTKAAAAFSTADIKPGAPCLQFGRQARTASESV